jgi:hypothetical protein
MAEHRYRMQKFPIYYPGNAQFQDQDGQPSGLIGAQAIVEIGLNNRPHEIIGIRVQNVYALPAERPQDPDLCCLLDRLDGEQLVSLDLAQQNVIVESMLQTTLTGKNGIHWHPFACSYPFRGGNNLRLTFRRLTSYPPEFFPVVHVTAVGWVWVSDELPAGAPPSTGFDVPPEQGTTFKYPAREPGPGY